MWWLRGRLTPMMEGDAGAAGGSEAGGQAGAAGTDAGGQQQQQQGGQQASGTDAGGAAGTIVETPEFTKAQVSKMISDRVNEISKKFEGADVHREVVNMIGEIIGSNDINTINQHLKGLHAQYKAQQMGMTPQGYQQYSQNQTTMQQQMNDTKKTLAENQFDQMKADPKYVDADLHKDRIVDLAVNAGLSVQQAYWAVAGEVAAQRLSSSAASDAEHRTMNNITNNRTKQVQGGDAGSQNGGPQVTAEIREMAAKVGMDPVDYMNYQNITTIEEARAARAKK